MFSNAALDRGPWPLLNPTLGSTTSVPTPCNLVVTAKRRTANCLHSCRTSPTSLNPTTSLRSTDYPQVRRLETSAGHRHIPRAPHADSNLRVTCAPGSMALTKFEIRRSDNTHSIPLFKLPGIRGQVFDLDPRVCRQITLAQIAIALI